MKRLVPLLILALAGIACGPAHVAPYTPKKRVYEIEGGAPAAPDKGEAAPGSLWKKGQPAEVLFSDIRALREHDLVVVKVEEIADARRSAETEITRNSELTAEISAQVTAFLKAVVAAGPQVAAKLSTGSGTHFQNQGSTGRTEQLTATVPAIVRKVLPNGNLFIEGHRVVLVNAEEQHFYISGVVRPIDIDQENSIKSAMIADAEIEFTGRGVMTDAQGPGWASRFFGWIWPF